MVLRAREAPSPSLPTGIRDHGDIAKSVRFGAAMVMIGSLFAGHEESHGARSRSTASSSRSTTARPATSTRGEYKHVEGKRILEPVKGKLADTLREMREDRAVAPDQLRGWNASVGRHSQGQLRDPGWGQRGRARSCR